MQCATAYKRGSEYYVHSDRQTTSGVWIASSPFLKLQSSEPVEVLGTAIQTALAASQTNVDHPKDWDAVEYPLPEMAGVKSWTSFMRQALCVSLRLTDSILTIAATKNKGPTVGFEPLDKSVTVSSMSPPEEIGRAMLEALSLCE